MPRLAAQAAGPGAPLREPARPRPDRVIGRRRVARASAPCIPAGTPGSAPVPGGGADSRR